MTFRTSLLLSILLVCIWSCNHPETQDHHADAASSGVPDQPVDTLESQVMNATDYSPEFTQLARNVEVVKDISDAVSSNGILTHEGVFGPLLFGEKMRTFFIELQPGMFLTEHPHPTESMVYTVSGRWVLCSEGKRQVMEPGSTFHFGSGMPTGWEAPFNEQALLYVVKTLVAGENYENYTKGLKALVGQLEKEKADGNIFYFKDLPANHPAVLFARQVNPEFDKVLDR